jgi:hypothetical protein
MPRSPLAARLPEIRSPAGRLRENTDLISPPARGKIGVALGQRPYRVKVIGQNDHGVNREWMLPPHLSESVAQFVNMLRQQVQPSLRQIDGEEEAGSRNEISSVAGQAGALAW